MATATLSGSLVKDLQDRANRLRVHSLRSTTAAGSGHPTSCMSAAEIAATVFFHAMRYDPHDPRKATNDRFVLSKGHAAPLLYAVMAEFGVLSEDDLLDLRSFDSDLEGHPTPRLPFVDAATGSLGQGLSVGIGLALAAKLDGFDARTYVLLGDGETAEGNVWEAVAWAGHRRLDNVTAIVDCNRLGQSQETMYGHDVDGYARRFESFGWNVDVVDGHSVEDLVSALDAGKSDRGGPSVIVARTFKGKGVSWLEDRDGWHGKPVPEDRLDDALAEIEAPPKLDPVEPKLPPEPPTPVVDLEPSFTPSPHKDGDATRRGYGDAIAKLVAADRRVVALDGEVKNSTYAETVIGADPSRFFEGYIAEQNLVAMAAGLAAAGKIPFVSTFGAFFARCFDQIRMAAISQVDINLVGSHAGISIGEDGPSQMALEDIAIMRAVAGSTVLYPSDAVSCERLVETAARTKGIVYLRTGRPVAPTIYSTDEPFPVGEFKVLRESAADAALLIGAGVTLHEALKAYDQLRADGIHVRVIDLYCVKPIDADGLRAQAVAAGGNVVTVEDHYPEGGIGEAVATVLVSTGTKLTRLAVEGLPRSGKSDELLHAFRIDAVAIERAVRGVVS